MFQNLQPYHDFLHKHAIGQLHGLIEPKEKKTDSHTCILPVCTSFWWWLLKKKKFTNCVAYNHRNALSHSSGAGSLKSTCRCVHSGCGISREETSLASFSLRLSSFLGLRPRPPGSASVITFPSLLLYLFQCVSLRIQITPFKATQIIQDGLFLSKSLT